MKAKDIIKNSVKIETIYENIKRTNESNQYKIFYPNSVFIDENIKLKLIEDGFKVYKGDWDKIIPDALIIEW